MFSSAFGNLEELPCTGPIRHKPVFQNLCKLKDDEDGRESVCPYCPLAAKIQDRCFR